MCLTDLLICSPNRVTEATVERTMAAAAEKPFMMLSVYFTTTDVYRPPTLASTVGNNHKTASTHSTSTQVTATIFKGNTGVVENKYI